MKKRMSKALALLCVLALALTLCVPAFAEGAWRSEGGWKYYENGAPLTGVRWIEAEGGRYIFNESGVLQTGDAEGDVLINGNLYYINPSKNTADPKTCYAVRNTTRRRDAGVTYYDGNGITFMGWITAGEGKLMYQTLVPKENVPGATKDIYIYVWRAQYIPAGTHPETGAAIDAGWYLFGDDGVVITQDGTYNCNDGSTYTVSGGRITAKDGQPVSAPAQPSTPSQPSMPSTTTQGQWNIDNIPAPFAMEADITMTGSGSGYQAKLVFVSPTSGVTFGPQFDVGAAAPYTGRNVLLYEGILHNGAGGQDYQRPGGGIDVPLGQPMHLMMGLDYDGTCTMYYNGNLIASYNNPQMALSAIKSLPSPDLKARVEVSGKHNGDSVNTTFTNIKIKNVNESVKVWGLVPQASCPTIVPSVMEGEYNKNIQISGTVSGIGAGQDWDSAYDAVSGIMQFEIWFI